jgi:hypothetical protein
LKGAHALYFYQANSAAAKWLEGWMIAEPGNFNPCLVCCPQHSCAFGDFNGLSVNLEMNHCKPFKTSFPIYTWKQLWINVLLPKF